MFGERQDGVLTVSAQNSHEFQIGVAGDWHGNTWWARSCLSALAKRGVTEVYHLGDFGIWPDLSGLTYRLDVEDALASHGMTMFVTPGNHEDYSQIEGWPAEDRGHDIGAVQWVTEHLALLPRGHRWIRHGWSFVSLGGAPSVDRWMRAEGQSWWAAEAITDDDVARTIAGGPADIMLAHDAPDADLGTDGVAQVLEGNPMGWPDESLEYAAEGRQRMTAAFLGVKPRLFVHGHYHLRDEAIVHRFEHPTRVVALDCDGSSRGNLAVLSLPVRDSGDEPTVTTVPIRGGAVV